MKSPASRKSAERQRRKDAGEVRVEVWLEPSLIEALDRFCARRQYHNRGQGLRRMVLDMDRPL